MGTTQLLRMHLSMKIIKIDDISVSQRLREIDQDKVGDLVESIGLVGLLHPIVIDTDNNLLAGNHRLEAYRILGRDTIECKKSQSIGTGK